MIVFMANNYQTLRRLTPTRLDSLEQVDGPEVDVLALKTQTTQSGYKFKSIAHWFIRFFVDLLVWKGFLQWLSSGLCFANPLAVPLIVSHNISQWIELQTNRAKYIYNWIWSEYILWAIIRVIIIGENLINNKWVKKIICSHIWMLFNTKTKLKFLLNCHKLNE